MASKDSSSEQNDQSPIATSLRLALLASAISTVGDAIATLAALVAIDEAIIADEKEKQDQIELDEKLQKMQEQIDRLTNELSKMNS